MRFALLSATCEVPSLVLRFPRHRDERDRQHGLLFDLRPMLSEQVKLLIAQSTDWDDHSAIVFQLIDKRLGDMVWGTSHDNGVERRVLRPAFITIAGEHFYVKISEPFEISLGTFGERFNNLDRIDFSYKPRNRATQPQTD